MSRRSASEHRDVLIVGGGPYGLAIASACVRRGIDHLVVGEPFGFWRDHMQPGMILRSGADWHVDPEGTDTLRAFLALQNGDSDRARTVSRDQFVSYLRWFTDRKGVGIRSALVNRLGVVDGHFEAELSDGGKVTSRQAILAPGFGPFHHCPSELTARLPADRCTHSSEIRVFERAAGRRFLVIGGRQGAFEAAVGLARGGADAVHVSYRHATPSFEASDWTWIEPLLDESIAADGGLPRLTDAERAALERRFFEEGRLKLEPWLGQQVESEPIEKHPETTLSQCRAAGDDHPLEIELSDDTTLAVDHVVLATGYRIDLDRIPYLTDETRERIHQEAGYPVLGGHFQSSLAGLYFVGSPATRTLGPFFGFVVGAPYAARVVLDHLAKGN